MARKLKKSLLYTKEGELDLGWLILSITTVIGLGVFILSGLKILEPSQAAWVWFGAFTVMSGIAGLTINRARILGSSSAIGEVSKAIASILPEGVRDPTAIDIKVDSHDTN